MVQRRISFKRRVGCNILNKWYKFLHFLESHWLDRFVWKIVLNSSRIRLLEPVGGKSALQIYNVTSTDSGLYRCGSTKTEHRRNLYLHVFEPLSPPTIVDLVTRHPVVSILNQMEGQRIELVCPWRDYQNRSPSPNLVWVDDTGKLLNQRRGCERHYDRNGRTIWRDFFSRLKYTATVENEKTVWICQLTYEQDFGL